MATMPNLNPTDPWSLAQKFLDQQNKEIANQDYMTHQMNMKTGANIRETAEGDLKPSRRYHERSAVNQADLEGAQAAEEAGLGKEGKSRYRGAAAQAGDPKFFEEFMDTLKANGVTNPIALAAVAGTGQIESGWSSNVNKSWSDPSVSGKAGTSGGALSWREDRLRSLYKYAAQKGEKPGNISAATQAEFFVNENPNLTSALQNAKDLPSAMKAINNEWKFAGYDTGGGSTGARFNSAANYLKTFGNAPLTAKDRNAGVNMANAPVENAKKTDPDGREYFEIQMDADGLRKIRAGMPGSSTNLVVDTTKPVGPKGQVFVKQYTGTKVAPTAPVNTSPTAPVTTAQAAPVKTRGYNGDEDEL